MNVEQIVRDGVSRGLGKHQCRELTGLGRASFKALLASMGELAWPAAGKSLDRKLCDEARRGYCSPAQAAALAHSRARRKAKRIRSVRGVSGTVDELAKHFKSPVSGSTIRRRLAAGESLEQALFSPRRKRQHGNTSAACQW